MVLFVFHLRPRPCSLAGYQTPRPQLGPHNLRRQDIPPRRSNAGSFPNTSLCARLGAAPGRDPAGPRSSHAAARRYPAAVRFLTLHCPGRLSWAFITQPTAVTDTPRLSAMDGRIEETGAIAQLAVK